MEAYEHWHSTSSNYDPQQQDDPPQVGNCVECNEPLCVGDTAARDHNNDLVCEDCWNKELHELEGK